jgi:hypothetical protein
MLEVATGSKELKIEDAISPETRQPLAGKTVRRISSREVMPLAEGGYF